MGNIRRILFLFLGMFLWSQGILGQVDPSLLSFSKAGSWPTPKRLQETPTDVATDNGYAYLALGTNGLLVADCSNILAPKVASRLSLTGNFTMAKYVTTNVIGLCSETNGLVLIDVANAASPKLLSTYKDTNRFRGFSSLRSNLFIAVGTNGVVALDISKPSAPVYIKTIATPGVCNAVEARSDLDKGWLFYATGTNGLTATTYTNVATIGTGVAWLVQPDQYQENFVGVLGWFRQIFGFSIWNNQTIVHPFERLNLPDPPMGLFDFVTRKITPFGIDIGAQGPKGMYVFSDDNRIFRIKDIRIPLAFRNPAPEVGFGYSWDGTNDFFATPAGLEIFTNDMQLAVLPLGGNSSRLAIEGNRVYVNDGGSGVRTLGWDNTLGSLAEIGKVNPQTVRGMAVVSSNVFLATVNRFQILGYSNPQAPVVISNPGVQPPLTPGDILRPRALAVGGKFAFLSTYNFIPGTTNAMLAIYDISNPANPQLARIGDFGGFSAMEIVNDRVYGVIAETGKFFACRFDADTTLTPFKGFAVSPGVGGLKVSGTKVYLCDGAAGLRIFDVSDPSTMTQVGAYVTAGSAVGVDVQDSIAYVADSQGGVVVLDVTNAAKPTLITNLVTSAPALDVKVGANTVFAAVGSDGVAAWRKLALTSQSISFAAIPDVSEVDDPFPIVATASSGLPVRFTIVGGPATVSGNYVTPKGAGAVRVRATQDGNSVYAAAFAEQVFSIRTLATAVTPWVQARYPNWPAAMWEPDADPDGDGLSNLGEFFFNTDPGDASSMENRPSASVLDFGGSFYLLFHYPKPRTTRYPMAIEVADFYETPPRNWVSYPVDFGGGTAGDFFWLISNDGSFPLIRFTIQYP